MVRKYIRRVISSNEIEKYRSANYKAFDPHLHTGFSYDTLPHINLHPRTMFNKMIDEGWDFVTFTDHDAFLSHETFDQQTRLGGKLISGIEISIKPDLIDGQDYTHTLHINIYDIDNQQHSDLKELAKRGDYRGFKDYLKHYDIPHVLNHPTWWKTGERANWHLLHKIIDDFDVIEVINRQHIRELNDVSFEIAAELGKGIVASSDSHCGHPRMATLAPGADFREMWDNIKHNQSVIVDDHLDVKAIAIEFMTYVEMLRGINKDLFPGKKPFVKSRFADVALQAHQFSDLLINAEEILVRWLSKQKKSGLTRIEHFLAKTIINRQQKEYAIIRSIWP